MWGHRRGHRRPPHFKRYSDFKGFSHAVCDVLREPFSYAKATSLPTIPVSVSHQIIYQYYASPRPTIVATGERRKPILAKRWFGNVTRPLEPVTGRARSLRRSDYP